MNSFSTTVRVKNRAAMLGVVVLAACGGGSEVGGTTVAESTSHSGVDAAAAMSSQAGASADSKLTTASGSSAGASATALSALSLESTTTAFDLESIATALLEVGSVLTSAEAPSSRSTDDAENPAGNGVTLAANNTVSRLSVSSSEATASPQFVRLTQEGHTFALPATTLLRYGDPATNRWVTKTAAATTYGECTNTFFRNDPAPGAPKVCQAWATTSAAIALANGPQYAPAAEKMPLVDISQIPTPWIGFNGLRLQATSEIAPTSDIGSFRTVCGVAKLSFDDPIVYPGQVGKSHLHTFFGNTGVDANSTPESLRTSGTSTCRGGIANRSAYWVPSLIDTRTGGPVIPTGNGVYYKTGYDLPTSVVRPIPAGLRMIAGSAAATTPGGGGYRFRCSGGPNSENDKYGSEIPNCDAGASMIQEIFFPQCWDGVNLDSPDHKSHMAYPSNRNCPADHPVAIPAIVFNIEYVVAAKDDPLSWRLSSDNYDSKLPGGYSSHGDWFNGWQSDVSDAWAKGCVQAVRDCHSHLVGDGRMMY